MKRLHVVLAIAALILLAALIVALGDNLAAAETGSPSPSPSSSPAASPSPSPTPTIVPASDELVAWALHWRRAAVRARSETARACRCLGIAEPSRLQPVPPRSADTATWTAAGRGWKHAVPRYRARTRDLVDRMTHPGGSGAARWLPLAKWVGWPRAEWTRIVICIRGESGGRPRIINSDSGWPCVGLSQILCHCREQVQRMLNPLRNLRHALTMWQARGWRPWSAMRAYW